MHFSSCSVRCPVRLFSPFHSVLIGNTYSKQVHRNSIMYLNWTHRPTDRPRRHRNRSSEAAGKEWKLIKMIYRIRFAAQFLGKCPLSIEGMHSIYLFPLCFSYLSLWSLCSVSSSSFIAAVHYSRFCVNPIDSISGRKWHVQLGSSELWPYADEGQEIDL